MRTSSNVRFFYIFFQFADYNQGAIILVFMGQKGDESVMEIITGKSQRGEKEVEGCGLGGRF